MKRRLVKIGALALIAAAGAFVIAASGVIPIKASSGHWAITAWFLHFSMKRSVVLHSMGTKVPPLDDPGLALKGAGHYETGCRPCHGSVEISEPRIPRQMTPHPPYLPSRIGNWEPEELFYIVKHGVKFTGMPAWPAQHREDEVWAVVSFLLTLPGLGAAEYRRAAFGEADSASALSARLDEAPDLVRETCARCHGIDGLGRGQAAFPTLAGQRPEYLAAALEAYARGQRHSGMMEPIAQGLGSEAIRELAEYYGSRPAPPAPPPDPELRAAIERGASISRHGIPQQRVPSCMDCHGPGAQRRRPSYPNLAGQPADYLILQLELFKRGVRGGSPYAHLMHTVATRLHPDQMRAVALYYASLGREQCTQRDQGGSITAAADCQGDEALH